MIHAAPAERDDGVPHRYGLQRHYIDGAFRASQAGGTFETLNPATNEVLAEVADGRAADVDAAVAAARRAFDEGRWPRAKAEHRAAALRRIAALIRERSPELIEVEVLDIGMPIAQMHGLAARAAQNFDYYAGVVTELHGRSFQVGEEFLNYTIRKPVGVAGLIMPWNAPLMLSTWRIAPALAAGNTVVLKPAEWSPLSSTLLAGIFEDAEILPGVFNVVHGFGETAGAPLSAHPGVNLICFTGEPATGSLIIAAGAPTLKRSSVELGGKSPVVVFEDADPELAVDAALAQIFTMNGQRCTAGSRLLVQRPLYEPSSRRSPSGRARSASATRAIRRTELGPLIRREHCERVLGYIESARERGRARARRRRAPARPGGRQLPRGHGDRRRRRAHARLPGGDLRPGAGGDAVRRRGRRDPPRQRHAVRARRLRVDERHPPRAPRRPRDRHRHVLDQLPERARPAHAVRRRQARPASAARAATTRSTSTATPRSSTSRSARTPSRGSGSAS